MIKTGKLASVLTWVVLFLPGMALAQTDPGVQSGNRGTGATLINPANDPNGFYAFFQDGLTRFQEMETVSNSANVGLGPRFNSNQCSSCHAQPAVGGTGAAVNPQFQFTRNGVAPGNTTPYFITANGPTLEARFPFFFNNYGTTNTNSSHGRANLKVPNGDVPYGGANLSAPNGGVEDLYTVTGRSDAGSCNLPQPNFSAARAANNIIFRIPTPVFGAGLIENLDDSTLLNNQLVNNNNNLGISGSFNRNGNDGTITRFGWKAQNKSLLIFAGEAYNVEQGVSNESFPNERSAVAGCVFNGSPEDSTNLLNQNASSPNFGTGIGTESEMSSDVVNFAAFIRLSAPAAPAPSTASTLNGANQFNTIGCNLCHSPSLTTGPSIFTGMSNVTYNPYSDFALHSMGTGLADGIHQGAAGANQFRTAPLWGLGQRLFFLHDGRTSDLIEAIQAHSSSGSEATLVIRKFNALSPANIQDLLNFLRSL